MAYFHFTDPLLPKEHGFTVNSRNVVSEVIVGKLQYDGVGLFSKNLNRFLIFPHKRIKDSDHLCQVNSFSDYGEVPYQMLKFLANRKINYT